MASYDEVTQILGVIAAAYPNFKLTKATIDIYARLLADLDAETLAVAAEQAVAQSEFFPTVAKIRETQLAIEALASPDPDAESAWSEVMGEVARVGYMAWEETRWSTELVRQTARQFWRDACLGDVDNLTTVRAQFRNAYTARLNRQRDRDRLLPQAAQAVADLMGQVAKRLAAPGRGDRDADES